MERRPGVADPFLQVGSYGSHIGHEANRVLKNLLVDSLEHIFGSRVGFDPQGEIDMSVAKDLAFNRRALKLKRKDSIFHKNLQKLAGGQTAPPVIFRLSHGMPAGSGRFYPCILSLHCSRKWDKKQPKPFFSRKLQKCFKVSQNFAEKQAENASQ